MFFTLKENEKEKEKEAKAMLNQARGKQLASNVLVIGLCMTPCNIWIEQLSYLTFIT